MNRSSQRLPPPVPERSNGRSASFNRQIHRSAALSGPSASGHHRSVIVFALIIGLGLPAGSADPGHQAAYDAWQADASALLVALDAPGGPPPMDRLSALSATHLKRDAALIEHTRTLTAAQREAALAIQTDRTRIERVASATLAAMEDARFARRRAAAIRRGDRVPYRRARAPWVEPGPQVADAVAQASLKASVEARRPVDALIVAGVGDLLEARSPADPQACALARTWARGLHARYLVARSGPDGAAALRFYGLSIRCDDRPPADDFDRAELLYTLERWPAAFTAYGAYLYRAPVGQHATNALLGRSLSLRSALQQIPDIWLFHGVRRLMAEAMDEAEHRYVRSRGPAGAVEPGP